MFEFSLFCILGASGHVDLEAKAEDAEADVSLVSGRLRSMQLEKESLQVASSGQILPSGLGALSILPSASDYLAQRQWQGLEPRVGETAVTKATTGRQGIAATYQGEGHDVELRGKPDGQE